MVILDTPWIFNRRLLEGHRVDAKLFTKDALLASPIKGQDCCQSRGKLWGSGAARLMLTKTNAATGN
jgi:hypothetical protein